MKTLVCLVLLCGAVATAQTKEERARAEASCKKQLPKCAVRSNVYVEPPDATRTSSTCQMRALEFE